MSGRKLTAFGIDELLLAALRSEIESARLYARLARKVTNAFLRDRLEFLAREERRHRSDLGRLFKHLYPGRKLKIPLHTEVPLPEVEINDQAMPLSEVLAAAMKAERSAYVFYKEMATLFPDRPEPRNLLLYFAGMEQGHYRLLEEEKAAAERMEEWSGEQPMIHVGP